MSPRAPDQPYVVLADELFDGTGAPPTLNPAITIQDGRVVSVTERSRQWRSPHRRILDFLGCTVTPGLIDPHVHLALRPDLSAAESIEFTQSASNDEILGVMHENAKQAFNAGVTCLRDCGSPRALGVQFRESCRSAHTMPRTLVSGRPITTTGGHCHWMGRVANSADELLAAVAELQAEGVDFIKVMATGGMMTTGSDPYHAQYEAPELEILVHEAHRHELRVAAHSLSAAGTRAAVEARVDTLEHCVTTTSATQDYDPAVATSIATAGVIVGVTAHAPLRALLAQQDVEGIRDRLTPHRHLRDAGVELTVHSDAGTPGTTFDKFALSVELFHIGVAETVGEAIKAATQMAARAAGIDREIGEVSPGYVADLLIVQGRLSDTTTAIRDVVGVVRSGVLVRG